MSEAKNGASSRDESDHVNVNGKPEKSGRLRGKKPKPAPANEGIPTDAKGGILPHVSNLIKYIPWHRGSNTDAALSQIQRSTVVDTTAVVAQFRSLNREIRLLCDKTAMEVCRAKWLPTAAPADWQRRGGQLPKAPCNFTSPEDYCFFTLLSIVNICVYQFVFRPFHPGLDEEENRAVMAEYSDMTRKDIQKNVSMWRSNRFIELESRRPDQNEELVVRLTTDIVSQTMDNFNALPGFQLDLPVGLLNGTKVILANAIDWNRIAKRDVMEYDLEPYIAYPLHPWNAETMEVFERRGLVPEGNIISPVAMGLIASTSLNKERLRRVQEKSKVLVEEWFIENERELSQASPPSPPSKPELAMTAESGRRGEEDRDKIATVSRVDALPQAQSRGTASRDPPRMPPRPNGSASSNR